MADGITGEPHGADTATGDRARRWRLSRRIQLIFAKYATTAVLATAVSHLVVMLLFWTHVTTAGVSLVASYVTGAVVTYFVNRHWTWRRSGPTRFRAEVLPYVGIVALCGIGTVGIGKLIHMWVGPMVDGTPFRGIALNGCLLVASGVLFLVKFVGLHRVFGRHGPGHAEASPAVPGR